MISAEDSDELEVTGSRRWASKCENIAADESASRVSCWLLSVVDVTVESGCCCCFLLVYFLFLLGMSTLKFSEFSISLLLPYLDIMSLPELLLATMVMASTASLLNSTLGSTTLCEVEMKREWPLEVLIFLNFPDLFSFFLV